MKKGTRITLPAGTVSKAAATEDLHCIQMTPDSKSNARRDSSDMSPNVASTASISTRWRSNWGRCLSGLKPYLGTFRSNSSTTTSNAATVLLAHGSMSLNTSRLLPLHGIQVILKKHAAPVHHQPNTWRDLMRSHLNELKTLIRRFQSLG